MEITSGQPAISVGGMNGFGGDAGIMFHFQQCRGNLWQD